MKKQAKKQKTHTNLPLIMVLVVLFLGVIYVLFSLLKTNIGSSKEQLESKRTLLAQEIASRVYGFNNQ